MIRKVPFWKRPLVITLMVLLAAAGGVWLALDRPMPDAWSVDGIADQLPMPGFLRSEPPERLYCAESPDTGVCRCITSSGERPPVSEEECRRRARASETAPVGPGDPD